MENKQHAYIVRVNPAGEINNLPDTLARDQVSIGWANLNPENFYRHGQVDDEVLKKELAECYPDENHAKSSVEYFFTIKKGDFVLIPDPDKNAREIYFGIISSDEIILSNVPEDRANERRFRHNVVWLNNKQPLSYNDLMPELKNRLLPPTVVNVSDFIPDILQSLFNILKAK